MQRQMLIVKLDGDLYGIDVRLIQEVIKATQWRELPDAPNFIAGIISLRDHIIPLIKIKRLLDVPMFDLYRNKKIIILNFGEGVKIGVMVDDVVGIHYYDDKEIRSVDTISRSSVLDYIIGMVSKDGQKVAILDVFAMFFTHKGDFLYKHYFRKGEKASEKISKRDFYLLKTRVEKTRFPFNAFTQGGIVSFISKVASLKGLPIEVLLKDSEVFKSAHFDLEQKRHAFFENKADLYVISEIFESLLKKKDHLKIWVLGNPTGEDAYSLSMLFHSFELHGKRLSLIHSHHDFEALKKSRKGVYHKKTLDFIPFELWEKYFEKKDENYLSVRPEISDSIIFDFYKPNLKYQPSGVDLIYAPNYLSSYASQTDQVLRNIYRALSEKGILMLGLFENIEGFANTLKKYYIKNRLVFIKGAPE